jgi:AcrR family transcriptional regulator
MPESVSRNARSRLSREKVLRTAVAVADVGGLNALTIRTLAQELGVRPMTVYHYVSGKDEILDAIIDMVFSEIELPSVGGDWRSEMRRRARSAQRVLRRHRWAIGLMESRPNAGPATLRHHDVVLGTLRSAGFSPAMAAHAYAVIDSFTYGFALQEASLPFDGSAPTADASSSAVARFTDDAYPHLAAMVTEHYVLPDYTFGDEFEFGLNLVLQALDTLLARPLGD